MHFYPWDNTEGFKYRIVAEDKLHYFQRDDYTLFLEKHGYTRNHPATFPGYKDSFGAPVSPLPENYHIDTFIGDQSVQWIKRQAEEPFFAWISFNSPHDPYDPPENYASLYNNAPIPAPVGSIDELANKPLYQRKMLIFFKTNLLYLTDLSALLIFAIN